MDSADARAVPARLPVHVAVDPDPTSATPDRAQEPFRTLLTARTERLASLTWGSLDEMPAGTRVLVGSRIEARRLERHHDLAAVVVPWSGIPPALAETLQAAGRTDIELLNIHHNAPSAAETALGLLLAASRGIPALDRSLRTGDWRPRYDPRPALRLEGGLATVLGRGAIGRRLARSLEAMGMTVRTLGRPETGVRWSSAALAARIAGSRVLAIAIPGGRDTENVVDGRVLDAMPGGIVVNVGRGTVVEEAALFERLADRRLFAAGLDVWRRVPRDHDARSHTLPSEHPFHELDNVVMTPHVGGGLGEAEIEMDRADAIATVLRSVHRRLTSSAP